MKRLILALTFACAVTLLCAMPGHAAALRVVALGDSLTAGYGLPPQEAFPAQLEAALRAKGVDVAIENAGISGDTSAGGVARVDGAIAGPVKPNLVILALGANDILRRVPAADMKKNLHQILSKLKQQEIPVLLVQVKIPVFIPGYSGGAYSKAFSDLADEFDVELYDSFLKGVAMKPEYNLPDRFHPNAQGVAIMVENILPDVHDMLVPRKRFFGLFR